MKKSIVSKLAVVCLTAVVAIGGVSMPASAKSKGYVFKYKGVSVTMNGAAKKLIKKAGKPSKKTVKKSCAYKGKDRTYTYKDFQLKTYSKTNNGAEYVSEIRFRSNKAVTKEGIRIGRSEGVDFLLPIGGGSVIDTAKGIGYGIANDFEMEDLLYGRVKTDKNLPIGVILTIAAAGSEMSSSMVLTIEDGMMKRSYGHDCSRPRFAIMNPELTYSLPAYQTASGAADIMMHTMERYFTPTDTDTSLTDHIAEGLMVSVRDAAQVAVKDPENYEARATLMWAGSLSHNGLTGAGRVSDFATHKIEHELGGMFDVAHGAGLASVWGSWARYVYKTNPGRFALFGEKVFGIDASQTSDSDITDTVLASITAWETWCHSIDMPTTLTELGIYPTDAQIEEMAEKCVFGRNGHIGFFQPLTKEDIVAILQMAK